MQAEPKTIQLNGGNLAIVDADDFDRLNKYKWQISHKGYAVRNSEVGGVRKKISMHRIILGELASRCTDHRNGIRLDNRKANLRPCTPSQNSMNAVRRRDNATGFKGVYFNRKTGKFYASICANKSRTFLGIFESPELAKRAYDNAAKQLHGEFAKA